MSWIRIGGDRINLGLVTHYYSERGEHIGEDVHMATPVTGPGLVLQFVGGGKEWWPDPDNGLLLSILDRETEPSPYDLIDDDDDDDDEEATE
jgi:hypothetical protein